MTSYASRRTSHVFFPHRIYSSIKYHPFLIKKTLALQDQNGIRACGRETKREKTTPQAGTSVRLPSCNAFASPPAPAARVVVGPAGPGASSAIDPPRGLHGTSMSRSGSITGQAHPYSSTWPGTRTDKSMARSIDPPSIYGRGTHTFCQHTPSQQH